MNHHPDDMQPEPWVLPHMLPRGCDQQGRWPTRQPMAAEAATDEGAEPRGKHRDSALKRFALWMSRALG